MTRKQIISSSTKIFKLIEDSNLLEIFSNRKEDNKNPLIITVMKSVIQRLESFTEADREMLKLLGLSYLNRTTFWIEALNTSHRRSFEYYEAANSAVKYLPRVINLLKRDFENYNLEKNELEKNEHILTIILPEDEIHSTPQRLIETLDAIQLFYETCCTINSTNKGDLSVVAIDSGSDKSFDFLGVAKIIGCVKDILFDIYDLVVFHKEKKLNERLDLIAKSLPIIETISNLENENKISKEHAEILRRNIFQGANKFLSAGAILPEFSEYTELQPRELLKPEQKLLAAGEIEKKDANSNIPEPPSSIDDLSKEENELLKKLLGKLKKNKEEEE